MAYSPSPDLPSGTEMPSTSVQATYVRNTGTLLSGQINYVFHAISCHSMK